MLQRFDRQPADHDYFRLGFVSGALTVIDAEDSYFSRDRLVLSIAGRSTPPLVQPTATGLRRALQANGLQRRRHETMTIILATMPCYATPMAGVFSPAYDIVPVPMVSLERRDLALTVGSYGRAGEPLQPHLAKAGRFGAVGSRKRAAKFQRIANVVGTWARALSQPAVSAPKTSNTLRQPCCRPVL